MKKLITEQEKKELPGFLREWSESEEAKRRVGIWFARFLLFMLVCTILSRGIYAAGLAQVTTGRSEARSLSREFLVEGRISAGKERAVVTAAGLRVFEVCVKPGQSVTEGEVLFRVDMEDLEDLLRRKNRELSVAQKKLSVLQANQTKEARDREKAQRRAREDQTTVKEQQEAAVEALREEYEAAKEELKTYGSWEEYVAEAEKEAGEAQETGTAQEIGGEKEAGTAQEIGDEQQNPPEDESFGDTSGLMTEEEWNEARQAAKDQVSEKRAAWKAGEAARDSAVLNADRALEDANADMDADSAVFEQQADIETLKEQMEEYSMLQKNNGEIVGDVSGIVKKLNVSVGERTLDGAAAVLENGCDGWTFTASLTKEQQKYISVGDTAELSFLEGKKKLDNAAVESIREKEDGTCDAEIFLEPDEELKFGMSGIWKRVSQSEAYSCCVPLSALYAENQNHYVLILQETATILGTELTAVKVPVEVQDKNSEYAALKGSPLTGEERLIVSATKAVQPGDRVRLLEP